LASLYEYGLDLQLALLANLTINLFDGTNSLLLIKDYFTILLLFSSQWNTKAM